ncbi:carboxypeptidase regulatory-like domain-containing protein [Frigoriglobus tundricola]|uniref:Carboxypeptidase regulatory-like domain-containing protein n=1 Tax=Frigoriglobus tundricola TaxID=2774151 RepID=A0A6M5YSQ3_9BACT|nr:carboxypeptidase-like regulatory domain-containing protein [Frigoriglobus tundricola]QJW96321.1 hypothetical protein FTUN_3878 [Frigoriglobus tundricola]
MRGFRFLVLVTLATAGVPLVPAAARAHDLRAVVTVADAVRVDAYFDDDTPAESAEVQVTDAAGNVIASGRTDERGVWTFPRPAPGAYTLAAKSVGHGTTVAFTVDGSPGAPVAFTGQRMSKPVALAIGAGLLLGISAASWFRRRRRVK